LVVVEIEVFVAAAGMTVGIVKKVVDVGVAEADEEGGRVAKWLGEAGCWARRSAGRGEGRGEEENGVGADVSVWDG